MLQVGGNLTWYNFLRVMAYIPMRSSNMDHDFLYSLLSQAEGDPSEFRYKSAKLSIQCGFAQLVQIHEHRSTPANRLIVYSRLVSSRSLRLHTKERAPVVATTDC